MYYARLAHDKRILNERQLRGDVVSLAGPAIYVDKASVTTWGRGLTSPTHYRGYIREKLLSLHRCHTMYTDRCMACDDNLCYTVRPQDCKGIRTGGEIHMRGGDKSFIASYFAC